MSIETFNSMTPLEYQFALEAWGEGQQTLPMVFYDGIRFLSLQLWNSRGRTLKRMINDPKKFLKFPWEAEELPKQQTMEEMKQALKGIAEAFGKKKK